MFDRQINNIIDAYTYIFNMFSTLQHCYKEDNTIAGPKNKNFNDGDTF